MIYSGENLYGKLTNIIEKAAYINNEILNISRVNPRIIIF